MNLSIRSLHQFIQVYILNRLEPSLKAIEDIYLNELMKTADAQEGLRAFLDKRKPEWKNC